MKPLSVSLKDRIRLILIKEVNSNTEIDIIIDNLVEALAELFWDELRYRKHE
jgi:hypothetical protein